MAIKATASDYRRAAALHSHRLNDDEAGVNEVLDGIKASGRPSIVLMALVDLLATVAEDHLGEHGHEAFGETTEWLAANGRDEHIRRAANMVRGYQIGDRDRQAAAAWSANQAEGGGRGLLTGISDVYSTLLPTMSSPGSLARFEAATMRIAARETNRPLPTESDNDQNGEASE
jgi:hypothetical protein